MKDIEFFRQEEGRSVKPKDGEKRACLKLEV